jgi:hypothetical protein
METELDEETIRDISAELTTLRFVTEILLTNFMRSLPPEHREPFINDLLRVGRKTDHLRAETDEDAEQMADIAVRANERLERLVRAAQQRLGER